MRRLGIASLASLLVCVVVCSQPVSADDEVEITKTELDESGQGTIEFSIPADLTSTIDVTSSTILTQNGTVIPASVTPVPSAGLEIVMMIDTSGSMREGDAIGAAKAAALGFLDILPPEVAVGVVSFADTPSLTSPLNTDRAATADAISRLDANGETALYDAFLFAKLLFSGATLDRQIILLSDGGDTVSTNDLTAAIDVAAGIRTSAITLVSSEADLAALEQLAKARGGNVVSATDPAALAGVYLDTANLLLNRYQVDFTASDSGDVSYEVIVNTPGGAISAVTRIQIAPPITSSVAPSTTAAGAPTTAAAEVLSSTDAAARNGGDSGLSRDTLLMIGAFASFLAFFLLLLLLLRPDSGRHTLSLRTHKPSDLASSSGGSGVVARATAFADGVLERRGDPRGLTIALDVAGLALRPGEYALLSLAGGAVLTLLLMALVPPVLGLVIGIVATPLAARSFLHIRMGRRRQAFVDQLPDVLESMISALRAGYGMPQALDLAASQAAEPARAELKRVLFEMRVGRDPGDALEAAAQRMQSADFSWVVAAMQINREIGGELATVLESVADTVRERQRLRRQISVLTAEGRLSAYVLIGLPVGLALYLLVTQPGYYEPLGSSPGIFLPFIGLALLTVGWLWMQRIIRSEG